LKKSFKPRHYWDACTFLALLKKEEGKFEECYRVIKAAEAGEIIILTSAITFVEVIKLEKGQPRLPKKDVEEKIRAFFKHKWIIIREADRVIGESARELIWQHNLDPKDSIHVATAINNQASVLETFDTELLKLSGTMGDPLLPIRRPDYAMQLELDIFGMT